eukprot:6457741-Amphidinium_carterae.1
MPQIAEPVRRPIRGKQTPGAADPEDDIAELLSWMGKLRKRRDVEDELLHPLRRLEDAVEALAAYLRDWPTLPHDKTPEDCRSGELWPSIFCAF